MKKVSICLALLGSYLIFPSCKKYQEGGIVKLTRLHLFGGHQIGDSKTWKLKIYEVNGIDSTYLIRGSANNPDFYNKFITFKYLGKDVSYKYFANTYAYKYEGRIDISDDILTLTMGPLSNEDSVQCKWVNNFPYCSRNILYPEINGYSKIWSISKLRKNELILESKMHNSYKLIFSH